MTKGTNRTKALVTVVLLITICMAIVANATAEGAYYRVVDSIDKANIRDTVDNRVLDSIPAGTQIYVVERGRYFSIIEYEGCIVKIYNELIEPVDPNYVAPAAQTVRVPEKEYTLEGTAPYRIKLSMGTYVNVRRARSADAGSSGKLYRGDIVYVKEIKGNWATIIYNNRARYIETKWIELITDDMEVLETPIGTYEVYNPRRDNTTFVYMRKDKSVGAKVLRKVRYGTIVEVTEDFGAWAKIYIPELDKEGYMMTFYLRPVTE